MQVQLPTAPRENFIQSNFIVVPTDDGDTNQEMNLIDQIDDQINYEKSIQVISSVVEKANDEIIKYNIIVWDQTTIILLET